jgi:EXLDI family protein
VPNKTIYVSDDDLSLYGRAQELAGGNLSSAITTALRRFVEIEEGRREGFDEVVLHVGSGFGRKIRFSGRLLGEWNKATWTRMEVFRVYRSRTGKYVVYTERTPDWTPRDAEGKSGGWREWLGIGNFSWGETPGDSTMQVVSTLDELREKIPAQLFDMVAAVADLPDVEDLDI